MSIEYPANHKVGMRVTQGGSMCANCRYVSGNTCTEKHFIKWNESKVIPAPTDRYCCDFWEGRKSPNPLGEALTR